MRPAQHILIIGFGDIGERVARMLGSHCRIYALVRTPERTRRARELGVVPVQGDLANRNSLVRLAGLAGKVFHFAPPPAEGAHDIHTRNLLSVLRRTAGPSMRAGMLSQQSSRRIVYIGTTGVYGDCAGARIDERQTLRPGTARAQRRMDAECALRQWCRDTGGAVSILRAPGIYAEERLPLGRLRAGTPALTPADDVFTNHIHADDLARAAIVAMYRAAPGRAYNVVDDSAMLMGEYFDLVADRFAMARPVRISRAEAAARLPPMLFSFMSESRRISNGRIKRELRYALHFPTVEDFLRQT